MRIRRTATKSRRLPRLVKLYKLRESGIVVGGKSRAYYRFALACSYDARDSIDWRSSGSARSMRAS